MEECFAAPCRHLAGIAVFARDVGGTSSPTAFAVVRSIRRDPQHVRFLTRLYGSSDRCELVTPGEEDGGKPAKSPKQKIRTAVEPPIRHRTCALEITRPPGAIV